MVANVKLMEACWHRKKNTILNVLTGAFAAKPFIVNLVSSGWPMDRPLNRTIPAGRKTQIQKHRIHFSPCMCVYTLSINFGWAILKQTFVLLPPLSLRTARGSVPNRFWPHRGSHRSFCVLQRDASLKVFDNFPAGLTSLGG